MKRFLFVGSGLAAVAAASVVVFFFMLILPAPPTDQAIAAVPGVPNFVDPGTIGHATFSGGATADLAAGRIDPRVRAILAASPWDLHVGVMVTGHQLYVHGTRTISNHIFGRAADITKVAGKPVSASNPEARAFVAWLTTASPKPDEVGSPFPEFDSLPGWFSDSDHRDHVHLGWDR